MSAINDFHEVNISKRLKERERRVGSLKDDKITAELIGAPPMIEGMLADGTVPVNLFNNGLQILVPKWTRVRDNDQVLIFIDDNDNNYLGSYVVNDAEEVEFPIRIDLPERNFILGKYKIQYLIEAASNAKSYSFPLYVTIDRDPPIPAGPARIADEYNNTITREDLSSLGDSFPILIPSYSRIEVGDIVKVLWRGDNRTVVRLPDYNITEEDKDAEDITIEIPDNVIIGGGEGNAVISYNLVDRAGNISVRSPEHSIAVIINPAAAFLTQPRVPLAENGAINDAATRMPVNALIPKYTNILPGDVVTLRWRKQPVSIPLIVPNPVPLEAYVLDIPISREKIWEVGSGTWEVDYLVTRGQIVTISDITPVEVDLNIPGPEDPDKTTDVNESLLEATLVGNGVKETNKLRPGDLNQGAVVTVPYYSTPVVDDTIRIHWGGRSSGVFVDYKVKQDDISDAKAAFKIEIGAAIIDITPESDEWELTYDLINATNDNLGQTALISVHLAGPGGPAGLAAPKLLGKNDRGWLIEGELVNPLLSVLVNAYENMTIGDIITLHWIGNSKANGKGEDIASTKFAKSLTLTQENINQSVQMVIEYDPYIKDISYGSAVCYYSVEQFGHVFNSENETVKVDLEGPG